MFTLHTHHVVQAAVELDQARDGLFEPFDGGPGHELCTHKRLSNVLHTTDMACWPAVTRAPDSHLSGARPQIPP